MCTKYFKLFFSLFALLLGLSALGQAAIVKGTVVDETGVPLLGATIIVEGTTNGVTTDFDGNYLINVKKDNAVLVFSYLGFETQNVILGNQIVVNVIMKEDLNSLEEVQVVAFSKQKKSSVIGSVSTINTSDLKLPSTNLTSSFAGQIAGMISYQRSGEPGQDNAEFFIRGVTTFGYKNDPLILLDGLQITTSDLARIEPDNVASFSIMKDATATSLYGARGANGVILISTFKGKDSDFKFNFTSKFSTYSPIDRVDVLTASEFTEMITSSGDQAYIDQLGSNETDWQDVIYQTALGKEYNYSLTGNKYGIPMRLSLGIGEHDGVLLGDKFNRNTASLNLNPSYLDNKLDIDLNIRYMDTKNDFADRGAIGNAVRFDPTKPVFNGSQYAGYYAWIDPASGNQYAIGAPTNPLALLNLIDDNSDVERIISNIKLDYKLPFLEGLTATVNLGYDDASSDGSRTTSELIPTSDPTWNGALSTYTQSATNTLLDAYVTYEKSFDDSSLNAVAGYSCRQA